MEGRRRSLQRQFIDDHSRITLLEDDADDAEERFEETNAKLDGIRNLLMAVLVSLATGAILFALNLVAVVLTR